MTSVKVQFLLWLSEAMGAFCSRRGNDDKVLAQTVDHFDDNKSNKDGQPNMPSKLKTSPQKVDNLQEPAENRGISADASPDEFYDGIPRFADSFLLKSLSVRSRQKVSEVSSRLGRAGTVGFGKAVEVLDNLGSSMTSLNAGSGFVSGASTKGNEIGILAFEVANTVVKGFNLMQSLSDKNIKLLKEELFLSKAVKDLVSKDVDELLQIVAADKREELKIFSDEVVRFGNRSKDPQWHNMDRYFEKIGKEHNSQRQSNDGAELIMQQLMTSVQFTAELYHGLHALDRSEQDGLRKRLEEQKSGASQRVDKHTISGAGLKSRKKQVKHLKKKSLWSCSLEEIMKKLVDIALVLRLEINNAFGTADRQKPAIVYVNNRQRLGPSGLALHYANIVLQIDTLVAKSSSMPENTREGLYQSLPPNIKLVLRSKLPYVHVAEDLTVEDIKEEIQKTLHWLVPIATNTANSEENLKTSRTNAMRIETFHHADKDKVEKYVLALLLGLQRLAIKSGAAIDVVGVRSAMKSSHLAPPRKPHQPATTDHPPLLTISEQNMLQLVSKKVWIKGLSKSWHFDRMEARLRENSRLTKSWSLSSSRSKDISFNRISSKLPVIDFGVDRERALDVIDRVEIVR
ncbi:uncharacterized protein LOC114728689 isoform X2 [Neltuma alba]|uniref:uncharacterized protein LOC114728689 isoform X2 n=1 Tax=Neltuma alba TaxID=207710 RepID=UPI0010A47519|nr:uncharacterized protein LOC114728689 isoform X2 [Prosopis alba]